jgi:hypothetical protein
MAVKNYAGVTLQTNDGEYKVLDTFVAEVFGTRMIIDLIQKGGEQPIVYTGEPYIRVRDIGCYLYARYTHGLLTIWNPLHNQSNNLIRLHNKPMVLERLQEYLGSEYRVHMEVLDPSVAFWEQVGEMVAFVENEYTTRIQLRFHINEDIHDQVYDFTDVRLDHFSGPHTIHTHDVFGIVLGDH